MGRHGHGPHGGQSSGGQSSGGQSWGSQGWGQGWGHGWGQGGHGWSRGGPPGPPPWLAGIFGMGAPTASRGTPKVRRGDVRSAILTVLEAAAEAGEPINGYQVIQQIGDRSNDAWRPSPGSVYPTIQQLQDEGLVESDDDRGRRTIRLTEAGREHCRDNAAELAAVWAPFEAETRQEPTSSFSDLKPEIGQVMSAVWQIVTNGSDQQRRAAIDVLVDTRRRLYGVLADGHDAGEDTGEADGDDIDEDDGGRS